MLSTQARWATAGVTGRSRCGGWLPGASAHGAGKRLCIAAHASSAAAYKQAAAKAFVDQHVKPGALVAFGSGELVNLAIEEVGRRLAAGSLSGVACLPACLAAAHEAAFHGVPVASADTSQKVSVLVEQADQLDPSASAAIKGVASEPQQPQLPRLRALLGGAAECVLLVEEADVVPRLRGTLPVVIEEEGWEECAEELDDIFIGDAELWRRPISGSGPADARGGDHPYVSEEGHCLVDVRFEGGGPLVLYSEAGAAYADIAAAIEEVPGVVTHGLLLGEAGAAVVARRQGGPQALALKRRTQ